VGTSADFDLFLARFSTHFPGSVLGCNTLSGGQVKPVCNTILLTSTRFDGYNESAQQSPRARMNKMTSPMTFRITEDLRDRVNSAAAKEGVTVSEFTRLAVVARVEFVEGDHVVQPTEAGIEYVPEELTPDQAANKVF